MVKVIPCKDSALICDKIEELIRVSLLAFVFEWQKNLIRSYWRTLKAYCQSRTDFDSVLRDCYENHLNASSKANITCIDFIKFMQTPAD